QLPGSQSPTPVYLPPEGPSALPSTLRATFGSRGLLVLLPTPFASTQRRSSPSRDRPHRVPPLPLATSCGILPSTPRATCGCPSTIPARLPSTPKPSSPSRDRHRRASLLLAALPSSRPQTSPLTLRATCGCSTAAERWPSTPKPSWPSPVCRRQRAPSKAEIRG